MKRNKKIAIAIFTFIIILVGVILITLLIFSRNQKDPEINVIHSVSIPVSIISAPPVTSRLDLLKPENFKLEVTNTSQICNGPIDGFEVYTIAEHSPSFTINRKEINITEESKLRYDNAVKILNGDTNVEETFPLKALNYSCGGFASFTSDNFKINYPNVESAILVASIDTQAAYIDLPEEVTVRIYGKKGEDLFLLYFRIPATLIFNSNEAKNCNITQEENNLTYIDLSCLMDKLDASTQKQEILFNASKEFINQFSVKP